MGIVEKIFINLFFNKDMDKQKFNKLLRSWEVFVFNFECILV